MQTTEATPNPASSPRDDEHAEIRTRELTKLFPGDILAVDKLNLDIRRGEFFGLLGPNGAGKTTTIGMLTTRVKSTGGDGWVGGFSIRKQPVEVKRIIGVVTQFNTLDRRLSVRENLYYHGRYFGMSRKEANMEADRIVELVRLGDRKNADVEALSGGMQRRLLIGRALVHHPSVLFLDEPTVGIDPQGRIALWEILDDLHNQGQTILLTTHYMDEADKLCQRLAIMDHGRILALGTPDELKQTVGASTLIALEASPISEELLLSVGSIPGIRNVERSPNGLMIYAEGGGTIVAKVVQSVIDCGAELRDINVSEPTLETVFIKLTGRELRE
ncbi:MAG: ATP-binding cassette domain-containing protein [Chloroflexota bacterium]